MMSGSAYSKWALVDDPVHNAVQLASHLNCSIPRNMMLEHEDILKCLRTKTVSELAKYRFKDIPSFLTAMGPSRDGVLIPSGFANDDQNFEAMRRLRRRSGSSRAYEVMLGSVEDEASQLFGDEEYRNGIDEETKSKYLRTLVRNTFSFHLNEIFATVQNEYTDWASDHNDSFRLQYEAARAITDRLYTAPIQQTATWANRSGYPCFLYLYSYSENGKAINRVRFFKFTVATNIAYRHLYVAGPAQHARRCLALGVRIAIRP